MWRSHLRLALRSLRRDRGYAILNGVGLATAIAACALVALFVRDELSFDRHNAHADRIVAMGLQNDAFQHEEPGLSTPYALGDALVEDAAGVESTVRLTYGGEGGIFLLGDSPDDRHEVGGFFADATLPEVFTLQAVAGNPRAALTGPGGMVVTVPTAERVFGTAAGALGQSRRVVSNGDTLTLTVRAVVQAPPEQSSLRYDAIFPMTALHEASNVSRDWGGAMYRTFALLRPGTDPASVAAAADRLAQAQVGDEDDGRQFVAVPLPAFHFSGLTQKEGFSGSPTYLRLFSAIAALILLLSAINYVNLATARGARRAREVGVRKALGAERGQLVTQFLAESIALTLVAGIVGVALAALALPVFNETFGKALTLGALDAPFWVALASGVVAVGLVAGLYPALHLSRVRPAAALGGGRGAVGAAGGTWLRRTLVAVQFAAAVALLAMTGTVARQLHYVQNTSLGFEPEHLVAVEVQDPTTAAQTQALKDAFTAHPAVESAAGASTVPPHLWYSFGSAPDPRQPDRVLSYKIVDADPDYARTLGLDLAVGTWFDADMPSTLTRAVVVNESFADALNVTPTDLVGRTLNVANWEGVEVIGVVRDFHFASLRYAVEPVALAPNRAAPWDEPDAPVRYSHVAVRLVPGREAEGMAHLESAWTKFSPDVPLTARRVADDMAELHQADADLARVFGFFALVAVVLAVFGLVGLASYAAARRTKEIGVRRVLGASVRDVVALLSREYVALAAVGVAVATPVAVLVARRWLEGFAYHAPLSPWLFAAVAAVALVIALGSVAGQAVRAATADPTASLRSE